MSLLGVVLIAAVCFVLGSGFGVAIASVCRVAYDGDEEEED